MSDLPALYRKADHVVPKDDRWREFSDGMLVPVEPDWEAGEAVLRADHEQAPYRFRAAFAAAMGWVADDEVG
jgi:hypothetical protein